MTVNAVTTEMYSLLSEITDYPQPGLEVKVRNCAELLEISHPKAAAEMRRFLEFVEKEPHSRLEEIYTSTFDINPICPPYIGHHLFGETHKRGEFMVKLKKDFGVYNFSPEGELPDHLSVLLGFLAVLEDEYSAQSLIRECMVPALEKMEASGKRDGSTYHSVIRAVFLVLQDELKTEQPGGAQHV